MVATAPRLGGNGRVRYHPHGEAVDFLSCRDKEVLYEGPAGTGKAQPLGAAIYTPRGVSLMGEIGLGDVVLTLDGGHASVIGVYPQGEQRVYRLTFSGGNEVECTGDHLWQVSDGSESKVLSVSALMGDYLTARGRPRYSVPQPSAAAFDAQPIPIPAYTLGVLLGDGGMSGSSVVLTTADAEIAAIVSAELGADYRLKPLADYQYAIRGSDTSVVKRRPSRASRGGVYRHAASQKWRAVARKPGGGAQHLGLFTDRGEAQAVLDTYAEPTHSEQETTQTNLWQDLRALGLMGKRSYEKSIPAAYRFNSVEVRLDILRGLMDTDGTVDVKTGMPSFCSTSEQLASDVQWLVESLGGICRITEKGTTSGRTAYQCWIRYDRPTDLFRLQRKRELCKERRRPVRRMLLSIEPIGSKPCQCIAIDHPSRLYLTDHFVPTHNSYACLWKLHAAMLKYPGARALMVRKTLISLTASALVTYVQRVLATGNYGVTFFGGSKAEPAQFRYPNGSRIVVGGMDNPAKIMSAEYDIAYINESTELTENDWESITTRLRYGAMPYQQLIADCNPAAPSHWLNQRAERGVTRRFGSKHQDNPMLWDHAVGAWTERGRAYIETLDRLTGVRYQRLRLGRWVAAEGQVYDAWNDALHLVNREDVADRLQGAWFLGAVDWGWTNPGVLHVYGVDHDDRMILVAEHYHTRRPVEGWWIPRAIELTERYGVDAWVCDPSEPAYIAQLQAAGLNAIPAQNDIMPGVTAVQSRLVDPGDGRVRLQFCRDALIERDEALVEAKQPWCTEHEFPEYVWSKGSGGEVLKDTPVDSANHGCFVAGTMIAAEDGLKPIERVEVGDRVLTARGSALVTNAGMTVPAAQVFTMELSNGRLLTGTADHPIWVEGRGWVPLHAMRYGDILNACDLRQLSTTGSRSAAIRMLSGGPIASISSQARIIASKVLGACTKRFGSIATARFRRATKSIMRTVIRSITNQATLSACPAKSTSLGTKPTRSLSTRGRLLGSNQFAPWLLDGIEAKRGVLGIANTGIERGSSASREWVSVAGAAIATRLASLALTIGFAPMLVSQHSAGLPGLMTKIAFVPSAARRFGLIATPRRGRVPVSVLNVCAEPDSQPVYNLTVLGEHVYFAEGVLVHNCDTMRYAVARLDLGGRVAALQPAGADLMRHFAGMPT